MASAPPLIFSRQRKSARRHRAERILSSGNGDPFLLRHMAEDIVERLAFLRHEPARVLVDGFDAGCLAAQPWPHAIAIESVGMRDFDDPLPQTAASYDMVASINSLDTVNDLPGALIQMRELLVPGGLAIASFVGGMSLVTLRQAMMAAEPDRPAARMHPLIDPRSCPQLQQRAGWKSPVVDSHVLKVRYGAMDRLVEDLRAQAIGNVLADPAGPLSPSSANSARQAFLSHADEDGRVTVQFEIVTLTGWR